MPSIYYEKSNQNVYQIDEISQRLLVYVYLHGRSGVNEVAEPIGAANEHAVQDRVLSQLGDNAAELLHTEVDVQKTLGNNPDENVNLLALTESGEEFVKRHRADLSMPVEIAELAKRVARLRVDEHLVEDLTNRVEELEDRLRKLE